MTNTMFVEISLAQDYSFFNNGTPQPEDLLVSRADMTLTPNEETIRRVLRKTAETAFVGIQGLGLTRFSEDKTGGHLIMWLMDRQDLVRALTPFELVCWMGASGYQGMDRDVFAIGSPDGLGLNGIKLSENNGVISVETCRCNWLSEGDNLAVGVFDLRALHQPIHAAKELLGGPCTESEAGR